MYLWCSIRILFRNWVQPTVRFQLVPSRNWCKMARKMPVNINNKLCIDALDLQNKRVLLRVNFNVPIKDGVILNNRRIVAALESVKYALDKNAKSVVLISSIGYYEGWRKPEYSLRSIARELEKLLNREIIFMPDCVGLEVEKVCADPKPGTVILLENLRYHVEEQGKGVDANGTKVTADPAAVTEFRKNLSKLGDVYVNDAYGTAHRTHSSMMGEGFPQRAAGFLIKRELQFLTKAFEDPPRPFLVMLGGSKVAEKIQHIDNLLDMVDEMIIWGGMAYTFLKESKGINIGSSVYDPVGAKFVGQMVEKAQRNNIKLHLPVDFITADKFAENADKSCATAEQGIPDGWMGLDIGQKSIELFKEPIRRAKFIFWNGPPGVFEFDRFSGGTKAIMDEVVVVTAAGATTIIAGGDTATCAVKWNTQDKISYVSTGEVLA